MRFGLFVPQGWRLDLVGIEPAATLEAPCSTSRDRPRPAPFESIWVYDHFHTVPQPDRRGDPRGVVADGGLRRHDHAVAARPDVHVHGYRNPAYLAKVAATVDVISGGRVEMGIGAGWYEHEWRAFGYGFPGAGERIGMLDEGVQIMRQMWRTGTATLDGKHYQVDGAIGRPLPLQDGGIPLWIAGGGEKKTLRIAAQYADYTNFDATPETFRHKSEVLADHCRDVGRDFDSIVRSGNYNVVIGATEKDVQDKLAWIRAHYKPLVPGRCAASATATMFASGPLVGTPEQIVDEAHRSARAGADLRDRLLRRCGLRPGQYRPVHDRRHPSARRLTRTALA